ncbi:putative quinol monooxygenase [Rhodovulum kholense]|uniref:Quinol monooxygenase YgiN n=1 Tax=Rhodovulum kholense TaxID=453584 RepID=A0A8E2VPS5_9RHOB|nr:putative quinol monooxygenase [Rhodovulum kholense]PTW51864.1 quinol monooxygenase YgiN [Rhodovulum kholense]
MGVTVTGWIEAPPERRAALRAAAPEHLRLTRAEPGCVRFEMHEDPDRPGRFLLDEEFTDAAAFDAHRARKAGSAWDSAADGLPRDLKIAGLPE